MDGSDGRIFTSLKSASLLLDTMCLDMVDECERVHALMAVSANCGIIDMVVTGQRPSTFRVPSAKGLKHAHNLLRLTYLTWN